MDSLDDAQSAHIKEAIDGRERQLRDEIRATVGESGDQRYIELAGSTHDQGDESVANELMDLENAQVQRHVAELRALDRARTRLKDGEINICIDCGREIGFQRLLANPTAVRCIECQTAVEKRYPGGTPPRL